MKICVVNTKGGVGKTTTAVHLAANLAKIAPTLLIDGDPQRLPPAGQLGAGNLIVHPAQQQHAYREKPFFEEGKNLSTAFTHTVIDAGGRDSAGLQAALLLADTAIVPVGASNLDAAAMTDLLEIVELAKDFNTSLVVKVLLMRIDPRTKDTGDMLNYLVENGLAVMNTQICERVAFRRAIGEGSTVQEVGKDPQAILEMDALVKEVMQ